MLELTKGQMRFLPVVRYQLLQRACHTSRSITDLIPSHTELSRDHLTPEIALHLITPRCKLWNSKGDDVPFPDPYWAFYWPGGQALTRFILDNQYIFADKNIVDIGSGCGASAIACKMIGARSVIANDIDKVAIGAINLNAAANQTEVSVSSENLIGSVDSNWNIVLLGDMFYDRHFVDMVSDWIPKLSNNNISVYVGDPGRLPLINHPLSSKLEIVFKCELPEECLKGNNGMNSGYVWKYKP
ncbi:electron transfer flavoprotein beta subunit lysine methyltransferase-like isoform X1 [Mytilus galloprovincialis]|uniref:electron transfer flavoprotein beta subunit lysine methyltransferase-like isoform X1 n=2 Tax=Mytilus galloprovincialis TaxID=29158 RepID=UPI003F7BBD45